MSESDVEPLIWQTAIEGWVERDVEPGTLAGTHPAVVSGPPGAPRTPGKAFTRPICVYPQVARYQGSGDPSLAENFVCVVP